MSSYFSFKTTTTEKIVVYILHIKIIEVGHVYSFP